MFCQDVGVSFKGVGGAFGMWKRSFKVYIDLSGYWSAISGCVSVISGCGSAL